MAKKPVKKIVKKAAPKKATKKVAKPAKKEVKKAAPKKVAKKVAKPAKKAVKKTATKRKPNAAFMKALTPSSILANIIGSAAVPRTEAVKKIWDYIKKHGLQDKANRRNINADEKLMPLFGKAQITMFELAKYLSKHLS